MSLYLYTKIQPSYIVVTDEQIAEGSDEPFYCTRIMAILGRDSYGSGEPLLDVDEVWSATSLGEHAARLMHELAITRAEDERFDDTSDCVMCSERIDPLDQDATNGACGRCASEWRAMESAAS